MRKLIQKILKLNLNNKQDKYSLIEKYYNDIISKEKSINISNMIKFILWNNLLEIEWLILKNTYWRQADMIKISESCIVSLLDVKLDSLLEKDK
jgi:hypothetical protein